MIKIGNSDTDKTIKELQESREIIRTIMEFGINQQQILRIIYLLSLELENNEAMLEISSVTKNYVENMSENTTTKSEIIV
tara:strand:+ start:1125 stop:1364 length:240 start_codon:yes stop_codon:yes gene_type:complete